MQRRTHSQNPGLEAGIETSARTKKVSKSDKVAETREGSEDLNKEM